MKQYHDLVKHVLENGNEKEDRTGTGTKSIFGHQMRFDLSEGFPMVTTKKLHLKSIVYELLWFLSGSTSVKDLNKDGVHLWDIWATKDICDKLGLEEGELGPIYGKQWRAFSAGDGVEVDQVKQCVDDLKHNPDSRRLIVSSWNPRDIDRVFVAPCHCFYKFYHANGKLSLHLFQRSADIPVGVPFNIAEYSLLLMMMAQVTGLKAHEFVHTICDGHIYVDQIDGVKTQLAGRETRSLPTVKINPDVDDIFKFKFEDFELQDYNPHDKIKFPVAL